VCVKLDESSGNDVAQRWLVTGMGVMLRYRRRKGETLAAFSGPSTPPMGRSSEVSGVDTGIEVSD
jgi:hypothetical protein